MSIHIAFTMKSLHTVNTAFAAGLIALLTAFAAAVAFLFFNRWVGAGDLRAFGFFSVFFAGACGLAGFAIASSTRHRGRFLRYSCALMLGVLIGVCFNFLVTLLLGPGAFSFPVLHCWLIAGAAGMIFAVASTTDDQ